MKNLRFVLVLAGLLSFASQAAPPPPMFPTGPNPDLTPGSLCDKPDAKRYPEGIPYCNRDVGSGLKHEVIGDYDRELGFHIASMQRTDFKIDHYFPLCMGGSNKADNLWPQHKSVYAVTDPLEPLICQKMADGKLLQKDAVQYVIRAKAHLNEVPSIIQKIQSL